MVEQALVEQRAQAAAFRRCEVTGFRVHRAAERLITVNAVTAVAFLALGGALALLIALTRWQAVHLLPAEWFYRFVTAHGTTMLVFWMVFFEVAGLYFGGAVLLNARLVGPKAAWTAYGLMLAGAVMAEAVMLSGRSTVMLTAYPPLKGHPLFYLGLLLFAVGALVAVVLFLATVLNARREGVVTGSLPLVTYAFVAAAVLAVFALLSGAMALIPTFAWSMGWIPSVDPAFYRLLFWGFGHGSQQVNLAAMVGVWYALASLTTGARPVHEGLSRVAFLLYVLFIQLGSIHHLLVDPGLGTSNRIMNTSYFLYLAVLASLIHAFSIPGAVEVAQRERGFGAGLFGWLRRAPWGEPGFSALALSFVIFGFLAGVSGVLIGTMQLNMLVHNTLAVPGHFHATVVAGTTLAFMGITYYLLPLITRRQLVGLGVARVQPWVFAGGLTLLVGGMLLTGRLGLPRRVWDITYSQATVPVPGFDGLPVQLGLALVGIGGVVSVIGGALFVGVALATLLAGRTSPNPVEGLRLALAANPGLGATGEQPPAAGDRWGRVGLLNGFHAPGTLALCFLFLAWFAVSYAVAWVGLSRTWWVS